MKTSRPRRQRIRATLQVSQQGVRFGGWLAQDLTYLGIYTDTTCLGWIDGQQLYRLAKAIVRQFEAAEKRGRAA